MIKEDAVPLNVTAGIEGPKLPIKIQKVDSSVIKRAALLKKKKVVAEELNIIADTLFCEEDGTALFLED
jgi:hypothetical protein